MSALALALLARLAVVAVTVERATRPATVDQLAVVPSVVKYFPV